MASSNPAVWCESLSFIPKISMGDVENWMQQASDLPVSKQHKGYEKFVEGFIHEIQGIVFTFLLYTIIFATTTIKFFCNKKYLVN